MKNRIFLKIVILLLPVMISVNGISAQIASWSFNNVLTGTGSANTVAGNASLGSTIAAGGAFNGGTVYYGEGNWPAGSIDLNAYLEFSITPTAGHTLTVSSLVMQIRRSTTGTSGAGPNTWSLRSSLDGYSTDISSGVLTMNSVPATVVTLGIAFMNLPAKITFRLYGYNATVSSGGLNRFVYDDIVANGSSVLPLVFDFFHVQTVNQSADISWKLAGDGALSSLAIERSVNGQAFEQIKIYDGQEMTAGETVEYLDPVDGSGNYAYRLQMVSENGVESYSAIQNINFGLDKGFQLQAVTVGNNHMAVFRVYTDKPSNGLFRLFSLDGNPVSQKTIQLQSGMQTLQMGNASLKPGMYILQGENGNQKISTKLMIL